MQYQIKWFVLFLGLFFTTQKTCCQVIQNGSHWWDGQRLYIAQTGDDGHILMQGESKDMGGDKFVLIPDGSSSGTQHYKLASAYEQGWIFIRGNAGWRVDYVCQENLHFLAVRNPTGDCVHLLTMTPDDLSATPAHHRASRYQLDAAKLSARHSLPGALLQAADTAYAQRDTSPPRLALPVH